MEKPLKSEKNNRIVLDVVRQYGPISRPHIVQLTEIPRTTVYDALKRLETEELIGRELKPRSIRGRSKVVWNARARQM